MLNHRHFCLLARLSHHGSHSVPRKKRRWRRGWRQRLAWCDPGKVCSLSHWAYTEGMRDAVTKEGEVRGRGQLREERLGTEAGGEIYSRLIRQELSGLQVFSKRGGKEKPWACRWAVSLTECPNQKAWQRIRPWRALGPAGLVACGYLP